MSFQWKDAFPLLLKFFIILKNPISNPIHTSKLCTANCVSPVIPCSVKWFLTCGNIWRDYNSQLLLWWWNLVSTLTIKAPQCPCSPTSYFINYENLISKTPKFKTKTISKDTDENRKQAVVSDYDYQKKKKIDDAKRCPRMCFNVVDVKLSLLSLTKKCL